MMVQSSILSFLALSALSVTPAAAAGHHNGHSSSAHHQRRFGLAGRKGHAAAHAHQLEARDIHGRQLPGTMAMRKRSDGSTCKVRPVSSSSVASSSVAASSAAPSSSAVASSTAPVSSSSAAAPSSSSTEDEWAQTSSTAAAATSSAWVAPTTTSSSAAAATTTASSTTTGSLTPNGNKAGISAGDAFDSFSSVIGWWYDWTPSPSGHTASGVTAVSMLWGGGTADSTDASRLSWFKSLSYTPQYVLGFEEPDCAAGSGSAGMSTSAGAALWNELIAPMGDKGALLGSPSMCKQMAETWLTPFKQAITRDWDITNIHINKNSVAGAKADIDYYYNKYGKPIWVSEFACVDDSTGFVPCTDQSEINGYINDVVDLFESDSRVYAYAYSNGAGLGSVWPLWNNGLSASGQTYLAALQKYH